MNSPRVKPTPEDVGKFYDAKGGALAKLMGGNIHYGYFHGPDDDTPFPQAAERLTDHMIEKIEAKPGQRVLDLGCGRGKPAIRLADAVDVEIVGVSISQGDVDEANELARSSGLADRVAFQRANAMDLPFAAESFDAVWALESIFHMPDRLQVLRNVATVLKPGGRLVLTDVFGDTPDTTEGRAALDRIFDSWSITSLADFADYPRLLAEAGLEFREIIDVSDRTKYSLGKFLELLQGQAPVGTVSTPMDTWNKTFGGLVQMGYLLLVAERAAD
ncbi:SAM-dependent methyltransferase [Actinokineospora sp.]|uniref:SAM-dependent methyltransferase n=1 Tax=Actinokineospora sp. TaxID=1872133 RepID=UPI00403835BB